MTKISLLKLIFLSCIFLIANKEVQSQIVINNLSSGPGSLQSVIELAVDGATITFQQGLTDISIDSEITLSKNLTIEGNELSPVTLDANGLSRIFNVTSGSITLKNINFVNGTADDGGAIFSAGESVVIDNCTFSNNSATGTSGSGGAIYSDIGSYLEVSNSTFSNNTSIRAGGAIEINSNSGLSLVLNNVDLRANTTASAPGNGGGLHITGPGDSMITGGTVSENTASAEGGGLWNGTGVMMINNVTITSNVASGAMSDQGGAGVFNAGGTIEINNCTINDNNATGMAGSGGGILNDKGSLTVSNTTIRNNTAVRAGGGIEDNSEMDKTLVLNNVTLELNTTAMSPGNGGGLHITGPGNSMISGGLVSENSASAEGGGLWNGTGTMVIDGTTISSNIANGDMSDQGGGGVFNAGGTINILNASITNNSALGLSGSGGGVLNDLGVLEISNTEISGNTSARAGGGIEDNSAMGNTLILSNVTLNTNTTAMSPGNGGGLHITGPGDCMITGGMVTENTASAEGGGLWNGTGVMVINGTTITANVASGDMSDQGGGGVFNAGGTINIQNAIITNNDADGMAGSGGGVLNDLGVLEISNTEISGNTSVRAGGGIEDNSAMGNTLILTDVTLNANTTAMSPGNGGGLHITGPGDCMITGGMVTENTASAEGGGLWNGTGVMVINGTTITANVASGDMSDQGGGGVFNAGGTINIQNAIITNNDADGMAGSGGGVLNDLGVLEISNTEISGNTSVRAGGGIEDNSAMGNTLILTDVTLNANTTAMSPGNGGGLHITGPGDSNIKGGLVSNNFASAEGGGLWNGTGLMVVEEVEVVSNSCGLQGGGVFNNGGSIELVASTISMNNTEDAEGDGAGIYNEAPGNMMILRSTISNNTSADQGGAVFNNGNNLMIDACTIVFNEATSGAGISGTSMVTVKNTILASNNAMTSADLDVMVMSQGYNLLGSNDDGLFTESNTDQVGEDPKVMQLEDNGGPTRTHQLAQGSPAYNMGDPNSDFPDQRGTAVFAGRRDIGSYESEEVLTSIFEISDATNIDIKIYPNPTTDFLFIEGMKGQNNYDVLIFSTDGQLILKDNVQNNENIDLTQLTSGSYNITIQTKQGGLSKELIKI